MRIHVDHVPHGRGNRSGLPLSSGRPLFVTVHETGNNTAGMGARRHRDFLHNGGGAQGVSFHYAVDDKEAWHLVPNNERAWHAGDGAGGPGNATSLSVEHCVNEDADWHQMLLNGAQLVAVLCWVYDIPLGRVVQHRHWRVTECPAWMRGTGMWDFYIHRVGQVLKNVAEGPLQGF